ncbi:hypothetical protein EI94DRAFT_406654 [Lactarius quietus]|nr:hypothetical protein EI94DRAFT_406654 [Lactarius quietus]
MSSPAQTPIPCLQFNQILEAALSKYKKKTGKNILSHPLAVELQRCSSVDAILAILQGQAEAFEQFRGGDRRLMEGIRISVDVLSKLSETLGEGVSLVFPPAKAIFCGIGILLDAAKDVSASHDALVELFGRIEGFFKRLKIYTAASPTTNFAEVLVNVVVEVLNVLSIATKEMEQSRAKTYIKKLLGWADIEDALKRLDNLIREEHQAATAEILWNQIRQDVRKWFSPSDPSTNYNIACTNSHKGTTTWFFDGNMFKNWEKRASLLWVHGKPGSGKSILCSAMIKHIMALRDAGGPTWPISTLTFGTNISKTSTTSSPHFSFSSPPTPAFVATASPTFIRSTGMARNNPVMKP